MTEQKTERNAEIYRRYVQDGVTMMQLAADYGVSFATIQQIIGRRKRALGPSVRADMVADFVREIQENRVRLADLRDAELPPAFSVKGDLLRDENGNVVRDATPMLAATRELANQQAHAAKMLGLNAPEKAVVDSTVRYVIEGVDTDDMT